MLSDAAQIAMWPTVKKHLTKANPYIFHMGLESHLKREQELYHRKMSMSVLSAPKGSGTSLRRLFVEGKGLNSSFAIHQDYTGKANDKVVALGIGVGSGYLFETDIQKRSL